MDETLWSLDEIVAATGAPDPGASQRSVTGVSIDSRTLQPGDLFVAIKGPNFDGHEFVEKAFQAGATAALVNEDFDGTGVDGPLVRVPDSLQGLNALAEASRKRTKAKVIAVTGSVGKTGTKEAMRLCFSSLGPTHASEKSFNNHWGVPLSLARMPRSTHFAIFEVGMNHPGEITPLTKLIRPDVAIITTVEPVHLGHFTSVESIAEAKAEIFLGLKPGGVAILNKDNSFFDLLRTRAGTNQANVISFGVGQDADIRVVGSELSAGDSVVHVTLKQSNDATHSSAPIQLDYKIGAPGLHHVMNSLTVVGALRACDADVKKAVTALSQFSPQEGRGTRMTIHLPDGPVNIIDESYNANPASMRACLASITHTPRTSFPRRIAVLGDMLELGDHAGKLHRELAEPISETGIDLVFAAGPHMAELMNVLPQEKRGAYAQTSEDLLPLVLKEVRAGDVVVIKGSLGSRMSPIVKALGEVLSEKACEKASG